MTIFGADLSHYDDPNARAMFADGMVFMTHKAGGDQDDAELNTWWEYVKSFRGQALLGAYWVLYPGSPNNRADAFLRRLDAQCPGWRDGPFILQVDCEKWRGDSTTVPPLADIQVFCQRLEQKMPKLKPIVYAPRWVYGDTLKGLTYPLWASAYVTGTGTPVQLYPGDASMKWNAYSGQTPAVLQYSSSATIGAQSTCDVNAFRGTLDQLVALLAPGWKKDSIMPLSPDDLSAITRAVWNADVLGAPGAPADNPTWTGESFIRNTYVESKNARLAAQAIQTALAANPADSQTIVAGVLAQLTPEAIVAAIPTDLAEQVVTLLAAKRFGIIADE